MTVDTLRSRILAIWIGGTVVSYVILVIVGLLRLHGLHFEDLADTSRNLSLVVAPTLLMLLGHYFVDRQPHVETTVGQQRLVLVISIVYVCAFVGITAVTTISPSIKIDQPGINHYLLLNPWQPVVVGPIFYVFGASRRAS